MNKLPKWVIPSKYPALYDLESATVIEMTAKLYGSMNTLIDEYNNYISTLNKDLNSFETELLNANECFKKLMTEFVNNFIQCVDTKIDKQNADIAGALDDVVKTAESVTEKAIADGKVLKDETARNNIDTLNNELSVLENRMNTFATLSEGSTTADAELIDIRNGANGKVYATAGEAVRAQFNEIKTVIGNPEMNLVFTKGYTEDVYYAYWAGDRRTDSDEWNILANGLIEKEGNTLYIKCSDELPYDDTNLSSAYMYCFYDASQNFIEGSQGTIVNKNGVINIPDNAKFFTFSFSDRIKGNFTLSYSENVIAKPLYDSLKEIEKKINNVYVVDKNGLGTHTSLSACILIACENMDSVIYVNRGTYDIITEFTELYGDDFWNNPYPNEGLILKNRVHLIFSSDSEVVFNYDGSNEWVRDNFSIFNSGEYGFTIENATLKNYNGRYCVHDERWDKTDRYENKYINCRMFSQRNVNNGFGHCIGGGLGLNGSILIDHCVFENADLTFKTLVTYHNSPSSDAKSTITVKDSYFKGEGTFGTHWFGASTKITPSFVCGNSFGSLPYTKQENSDYNNVNVELIAWNNEIRN